MKFLQKAAIAGAVLASAVLLSARADAAIMTIADGPDTWTLNAQENCTTCAVTLSVTYVAGSPRIGTFLQGAEWDINDPNVLPTNTNAGFNATTAGATTDWFFDIGGANSGGCNFNSNQGVCGQWDGSGTGFLVAPGTYSWTFSAQFAQNVGTLVSGNIRAAYNVDPDGTGPLNKVFSPGGGTFGGGGSTGGGGGGSTGGGGQTIPEPASMLLFGLGALATGWRARRAVR